MSRRVATLIYSKRCGGPYRKAVLAYMADRANDDGSGVYCSKGTIADETEIARSTVFKIIGDLLVEGVIFEVGRRPCRNGFTVDYTMNIGLIAGWENVKGDPITSPPAGPVRGATSPPAGPHQSASRTPTSPPAGPKPSLEPSMNQEPLKSKSARAEKKPDDVSRALLAWASSESVASFIAYRKRHKAKALTATGAKRLAGHLQEIFNAGGNCDDALAMVEEKGWASIEPDWYFRAKGQVSNGRQTKPSVDRTLLQIADGLSAGTVRLDYSSRDPFAAR